MFCILLINYITDIISNNRIEVSHSDFIFACSLPQFCRFVLMAIDYDPFCAVCGGPFSHVHLLDFSQLLADDEQPLKETAYNMEILPFAQIRVSSECGSGGVFF